MIAGTLEVQMLANMARLQADMTQAKAMVGNTMQGIERAAGTAKAALGALGVGIGVGAIVAYAKSVLEAAEGLNKMSQKIGMSVEDLSKLKYAADQSDVSMESLAKGAKKLSAGMIEAGDKTSKSGKLFAALGVDLSQGINPALEKIADTFKALPDGPLKAALAVELFGKAGMDMIPFLNQGADGIRKMKEEATRLGLVMTTEMAQAAEKFNDSLKTLKFQSDAVAASFLGDMLPGLNRITAAMIEAKKDSGALYAIWVAMGGVASEVLGLNDSDAEKRKQALRDLQKEALKLSEKLKDVDGVPFDKLPISLRVVYSRLQEVNTAARVMQALLDAADGKFEDQASRRARQGKVLGTAIKADADALKKILVDDKTIDAAAKAGATLLIQLQQEYAKLNNETKENETLEKTLFDLKKESFAKLAPELRKQIIDAAKLVDTKKQELETTKFLLELNQEELDAAEARGKFIEDLSNSWEEATEALREEAKLLGLSNIDRQKAVLLEKARLDIIAAGGNAAAIRDINKNLEEQIGLLVRIDTTQKQLNIWTDLAEAAGSFFSDLVMNGKTAFDSLKQWAKQLLAEMIKIFATRWILQMGAAAAGGGGAGSALANVAGSYGSNTMGGTLLSGAATWGAQAYAGFASASSQAALGSAFVGPSASLAGGATGFGASLSGTYAGLSATGWGIIIAAVIAIGIWASKYHTGGPKFGGGYLGGPDGGLTFAGTNPGDGGRLLSPANAEADASMREIVVQQIANYNALAARLGGSGAGLGFGMAFAHDPKGNAPSQLRSVVQDAFGTILYDALAEMDDKEISGAMALELQRQMVVALQNTDLGSELNALFDGAGDVAKLTGEQIQALINKALELRTVIVGLDQISMGRFGLTMTMDSLRLLAIEGETIGQTFQRVGGAWTQLVDAFTSDGTKLTESNRQLAGLYESLRAFGKEVPTTREGWLDVARSLNDGTAAGAELFARMIALAPAFAAVSDAAAAMKLELEELGKLRFLRAGGTEQGFLIQQLLRNNPALAAGTGGMTTEQFVANLWTISDADYARYSATDRAIINAILRGSLQTTTAVQELGAGLGAADPYAGFDQWYRDEAQRRPIRDSLMEYQNNLLLGDKSPLDPMQQFNEAKKQYEQILRLAQSGDVAAMQRLQSVADTYLGFARDLFRSSSSYDAVFQSVFDAISGITGSAGYNTRMLELGQRQTTFLEGILSSARRTEELLQAIYDGGSKVAQPQTATTVGGR